LSSEQKRLQMISICQKHPRVWNGVLTTWANQAAQLKDRTLASVMGHVFTHLNFLSSPAVMRNTVESSFDPRDLHGEKGMTVYLVIPPEYLRSSGLLRLWIESLLKTCVKGGLQEKKLVRFVLDEAAALG